MKFVEGPTIQGFDLEGVFVALLNFFGYTNLSEIFIPHEIEENRSSETLISTNLKKLKHSESKIKKILEGESPSQDASHAKRSSCLSFSSRRMS